MGDEEKATKKEDGRSHTHVSCLWAVRISKKKQIPLRKVEIIPKIARTPKPILWTLLIVTQISMHYMGVTRPARRSRVRSQAHGRQIPESKLRAHVHPNPRLRMITPNTRARPGPG